jgi:rhodanese-related sulfurtransferase
LKNWKTLLLLAALIAGAGLLIKQQPSLDQKLLKSGPQLDARLKAGEVQVDPAELLDTMYNNNVALRIIDLRDESDYNLFHIIDSIHTDHGQVRDPDWVRRLPAKTVIVLVSNDEARAAEAWKILAVQNVSNLYILKGGINFWLKLYGGAGPGADLDSIAPDADQNDKLRYQLPAALGANHPASDPDPAHTAKRKYTSKIKPIGPGARKSGGCG